MGAVSNLLLWLTCLTAWSIGRSQQSSPSVLASAFIPKVALPSHSRTFSPAMASTLNADTDVEEPSVIVERVFATDKRPVILFDGVCNLCNGAVNLALDWDPKGKLRFSALQSNVGRALLQANGRAADDISSIVLVNQDGAFVKSDAILRITEAFVPFKPAAVLGRYVVPRFLRDIIYDGVANNRYDIMGKQDQCRFDADGEFEDRFVDDDLALKN